MAKRRRSRRKPRRDSRVWLRVLVPVVLLLVVVGGAFVLLRPVAAPPLEPPSIPACPVVQKVTVGSYLVPAGPIAGFCQSQLVNAAQVLRAAQSYGLSVHGQEIGVMTAIGESSLRNVNYGDTAGPDSRGIFQQRSNYGELANRMDPYTAARAFFLRMQGIVSWETLPPTVVAHTVQRNADPDYYTQYWQRAVTIVTALNRTIVPSAVPPPVS
ncbi:MAG: hypothetical protein QOH69_1961 [Actinomycetota bacterium]|jgi:hypothetical protein|nr:hypothetical protein [Actinomycetota bacterium]